jgi:hypothetical protein
LIVDATLIDRAKALARAAAAGFFEEFGEALDPERTDWDATAWGEDNRHLPEADRDELWPIYQSELVAETERLYLS